MNNELPEDLELGRELLEKFESADNHTERIRSFEDGIDYLNDHLLKNPNSPHKRLINNLKTSYTRSLLNKLPTMEVLDLETYFHYLILLKQIEDEIDSLTDDDIELSKNLADFINTWGDEASEWIERAKRMSKQNQ